MNKKILFPLVGLMALACNFLFPMTSATPQPQEVPDLTETAAVPTDIANPMDHTCSNLTPEECANAGVHSYSLSSQIHPSCVKAFADWDPGSNLTITLTFSDNALDIFPLLVISQDHDTFTRDKSNQFSQEFDTIDTQHIHHRRILTFTRTGFKVHYAYLSDLHPYRDCWELTYTIEK
jgi:hypothetical protein